MNAYVSKSTYRATASLAAGVALFLTGANVAMLAHVTSVKDDAATTVAQVTAERDAFESSLNRQQTFNRVYAGIIQDAGLEYPTTLGGCSTDCGIVD